MNIKRPARHAETLFNALCAAFGATCNGATEDERGWDFFVQFPERLGAEAKAPLDMQAGAQECLVQVKSTHGKKGIRLKLSNAREFANSRMPCFVILFPYEDGKQSDYVYLLHYWEYEIARTLKRVREQDAKGDTDLHRVGLRFPLGAMTRLLANDLLSTMEGIIGEQGRKYADAKKALVETVGFADSSWSGSVTFKAGLDEIVDMTIGLNNERLPASSISLRSVRFGVPAGTATIDNVPGHVSLRAHPRKCVVVISSEPHGHEVSLPCDLFVPSIPGLEPEQIKYRVVHPLLELIIYQTDHRAQFRANASHDDRHTLGDMGALIDLMHVFASPRLHFRVNVDGKRVLGGTGSGDRLVQIPQEIFLAGQFVRFLNGNTKPHDVPDGLRVSLNELIRHADDIADFTGSALQPSVQGSMALEVDHDSPAYSGKALLWPSVQLSDFSVYAIVRRSVNIEPAGKGKLSFALGSIDYARPRILAGMAAETDKIIAQEVEVCSREVKDELIIVLPRRGPDTLVQITHL
jgi:hypothetical protein